MIFNQLIIRRFLSYIQEKSNLAPSYSKEGKIILKYHKTYLNLGYYGTLFCSLAGIIHIFSTKRDFEQDIIVGIILGFLILAGIYLILISKVHTEADNIGIKRININGNEKLILWSEVKEIKFSYLSNLKIISGANIIKVNVLTTGFNALLEIIRKKISPEIYEEAFLRIDKAKAERGY